MPLNLDIWLEIIARFRYPRDTKTLRSLALASRCLSNLALNAIWRNGASGSKIASVINSFAPSPNEPFLEYIRESENNSGNGGDEDSSTSPSSEGGGAGIWVLNEPLSHIARTRALEYLARIREVVVWQDGPPHTEEPIWPILSASLSPCGPLLPNLRRLEIYFVAYDCNEYLIPLLSPSLKILKLDSEHGPSKPKAILTFLNLARASGCDLEGLSYGGHPIEHLPKVIGTHFKNMQNVVFPLDDTPLQRPHLTLARFLTSLPSLRSLTCHLATFLRSTDETRFYHTGLQKIVIRSAQGALRELFDQCMFPSVTEVEIWGEGQVLSFEGLELSCPHTCKLDLRVHQPADEGSECSLEFKHIVSLLSLPIEVFRLTVGKHNLTPSHLHTFAQYWPNLRSFKISSSNTDFDPLPTLAAFSSHMHLEKLDVRLPLCRLVEDTPKIQDLEGAHLTTRGSRSRLHSLFFDCSYRPRQTVTTAMERAVVEYLCLLFPGLEKLELSCEYPYGFFSEAKEAHFQNILSELRKEGGRRSELNLDVV